MNEQAEQKAQARESPDSSRLGSRPRRIWTWLRERLVYVCLSVGFALYALVLAIQAGQSDVPSALTWADPIETDGVRLHIAYPKRLVQDGPGKAYQALSAWLTYTSAVPPTPAQYLVALEPIASGVAFVDQDGKPSSPRLLITPTIQVATPATLHLRQQALVENVSSPVTLVARLFDPNGRDLIPDGVQLTVHLETKWGAFWRHLGQRLLSPATPLLTLAAGLVALAVQEYRRAEERRLEAEKEARGVEREAVRQRFEAQQQRREHEFQKRIKLEEQRLEIEQQREQEEKQAAHRARLAKIERIHLFVPYQLCEAVKQFDECERRSQTLVEWQIADILAKLKLVWDSIKSHNWQKAVLDQATSLLREQKLTAASAKVTLVQVRDPGNQDAENLKLAIDLIQAYGVGKAKVSSLVRQHGVKKTISALQEAAQQYDIRLDDWITRFLNDLLHHREYTDEAKRLLEEKQIGRVQLRQIDWPLLWPPERLADSGKIGHWLALAGLTFNPFGPEVAELDPRLDGYVIDFIYERARGARPLIVTGASGTGKTTAALMLAYDCGHPPANPREAGTFPIYYRLQLATMWSKDGSNVLAPLARMTARKVLRYLSLRPEGWLNLPPFRQDAMRHFLTLAYGNSTPLLAQVGRLSPTLQKALALPLSESQTSPMRLLDEDWLELLSETLPAGFHRYEWLVDVPGRVSSRLPDELPGVLNRLIDWAAPLATKSIHLKLFVSDKVAEILGKPAGLEVAPLIWKDEDLALMLNHRIRQAGGASLMAFCGPDVPEDFERRFIQAAQGSPGRLVRLGNALLKSVASHIDSDPMLTEKDLETALGEVRVFEAALEPITPRREYLIKLRQILALHFDEEELRTLCFDLDVDYDDLPVRGKTNKARALVEYLEHRGRISELVEIGARWRPHVEWQKLSDKSNGTAA